jgi:hypothetical protein
MSVYKDLYIKNNLDVANSVSITGNLTVAGVSSFANTTTFNDDVLIDGNLTIIGKTTSIETENVLVSDRFMLINAKPLSTASENTGISFNYKNVATGTISNFTSTTTIATSNLSGSLVNGSKNFIIISDSIENNGLYEVASSTTTEITIETVPVNDPLCLKLFVATGLDTCKVTVVEVSLLQTSTTGVLQYSNGNNGNDIFAAKDVLLAGGIGDFSILTLNPNAADTTALTITNTGPTQTTGSLVSITGDTGFTALNIIAGNVVVAENATAGTLLLTAGSNQIVLDSDANSTTISSSQTAASVFTIPDITGSASFAMTTASPIVGTISKWDTQGKLVTSLDAAEVTQLENIAETTISTTQWGYLGSTNQHVATSDDVEFKSVKITVGTLATSGPLVNTITDCNTSGGAIIATLPDAASNNGKTYVVYLSNATNSLTINRIGADTIADGVDTTIILNVTTQVVKFLAIGTNWVII